MSIAKRHAQAVEDHRYLDRIAHEFSGEGHDCVEIDAAVFELMADPTKIRALRMYESSIEGWFSHWRNNWQFPHDDERLEEIAQRYGC